MVSIDLDLTTYFHVFATSIRISALIKRRIYIIELFKKSKTWTKLLNHLYKLEFMIRCDKEITNLIKIGIFNIIDIFLDFSYKDLLPLIWVFKYKIDSDDFIIKYKSRLVTRGNL